MKLKNNNSNEKFSYFKEGLTAFSVIAAVIVFFFFIFKIELILGFFNTLLNILQPVILGAVIAFLINPITKFFNKHINKILNKIFKKQNAFKKLSLYSSITFSLFISFPHLRTCGVLWTYQDTKPEGSWSLSQKTHPRDTGRNIWSP